MLIQSSERGLADPHLLRQLEGQLGSVDQPGLQQVIGQRLQQHQQR